MRRAFRGVYLPAATDDTLASRVEAARQVLPPDARPDGATALQLWGLDIGSPTPLCFVTTHPHQIRRPGVRVRRVGRSPEAATGEAVTVFLAAARDLDLVELVAAGDWLARSRSATPEALVLASSASRSRASRHARRAAALVREGVDSVQETRLRMAIVLAGLPEPAVNPAVHVGGRRVGRVDLLLARWRVVVEYEGDQHRTSRRQWNRDVWRQESLVGDGYALVRVTGERMRSPRTVVLDLHRVLVERGYGGPPPIFSPEWRSLFATAR